MFKTYTTPQIFYLHEFNDYVKENSIVWVN